MRRRSHRHPALETAVFAAALLLSAFIARELWLRRFLAAPPLQDPSAPIALNPSRPPLPAEETHRTETAVSVVAPIKLLRAQPRRRMTETVPPPK